ncbi:DUF4139 domain-containing protein [Caulobacter sp. KR2-114]|uniref:DUF4139 domain-containing protein n=1 Tax=Caulobacter sp. KR2-114 TaxID=3400912 RepID=UPI003C0A3BD4
MAARPPGLALLLAAALAAAFTSARVLAAEVVSPRAEAVAVTVYRDDGVPEPAAATWGGYGLAMIRETRTVDLPAGDSRIVFQGVADGTLPQTAALKDLPGRIVEQNFDFDLLSPGSLIQRSVGGRVQVVRTNPRTGRETAEDAVLKSGPDGAVLDFGDRVEALQCGGPPERLVFDQVPSGLTGLAALSTRVRVTQAGRYRLTLAYLTVGLAWKTDYVARIAPDGRTLDLTGWITLANHDGASFPDAETSVVAGNLARQAVILAQGLVARRAPGCWPMGNSHHPRGERLYLAEAEDLSERLGEVVVTAERRSERLQNVPTAVTAFAPPPPPPPPKQSDLGDYKLYTLAEPTTVAARQTKQVMFLQQAKVDFDTDYVFELSPVADQQPPGEGASEIVLRLENKPVTGLGRALPAGDISLRQSQGGAERLIGEASLDDVAVGAPFELKLGEASDVRLAWRVVKSEAFSRAGRRGVRASLELTASNASRAPVTAEVRLPISGWRGARIVAESQPHGSRAGDPIWRLPVPAHAEAPLRYTLERLN